MAPEYHLSASGQCATICYLIAVPTIVGPLTLVDLALVVGIAVVLPLALGGRAFLWLLAAAVLMTLGVWCTAIALLHQAARSDVHRSQRGLLLIAGLAVWLPMLLAIAWAAAQHWSVPALSVPDMARTHGLVNGVGFVMAGLVATAADRRGPRWR
jgi:YndJ-like protein